MDQPPRLVYGVFDDNLVLLPEEEATARAEEVSAIFAASTYGEARQLARVGLDVPGIDDEDDEHGDEDPYDPALFEDWPGRAATLALDLLPDDLDDIGEQIDQFFAPPILHIDPAGEAALVKLLRERGYEVRRDDEMVGGMDPLY